MLRLCLLVALGFFTAFATNTGGCSSAVSWTVIQNVGGTCPGVFNSDVSNKGGTAFDAMLGGILTAYSDSSGSCSSANSPVVPSCATSGSADGCNQCTASDDDNEDDDDHNFDDDDDGIAPVTSSVSVEDNGAMGSILTYSITAELNDDEDPTTVMNNVEGQIELFFMDEENARLTWIAKARALGADIPEDLEVTFSEPVVDNDSIEVTHPGDFIGHHYNGNGKVRIGAWIGAAVAVMGLVVSAKYGMKAYNLQREADVIEKENAAKWANVEESSGELTMNPLADQSCPQDTNNGVRHRSGSGHIAV